MTINFNKAFHKKVLMFSSFFLLLFTLQIVFSAELLAQGATIRGFVYEKSNNEPVIFTNVYLYKTSFGAATDVNGYFVISKIPAGSYTLMVTYLGFDTLRLPITVKENEIINKKLYLTESSIMLDAINISAEKEAAKVETRTSVVKITPRQISQIPTIGGQPDLVQYLQVLPGVVFTGDQGGQLYIRGGSPIQNKVLLDGMIVYNPFHSIGLFSVFDTDIIRSADVYTGGFGAEYGGRISSIMDITTRDGNKKRFSGKYGASPFGMKLLLEGPIIKAQEQEKTTSSFVFSAKNSYLSKSSPVFYNYIDTAGLPFDYTDLYGKISLNAANGSKVNVFGFNFTDRVNNYKSLSDFSWDAKGIGTNFIVIPGSSQVMVGGNFSFSDYYIQFEEQDKAPRTSEISGFNSGLNFTYFIGKQELRYGIEVLGFKTLFDFTNAVNRKIEQKEYTTELAGFIKYKFSKGKFIFEPSFRAHQYASLGDFSPEPRLACKFNATEFLRFKLATGLYAQNLISATSDRDVVNLFYGFLSGPDNLPSKFKDKEITHNLQKAAHVILGSEIDVFNRWTINLEAYIKDFYQLTNLNRNKLYDDNADNADKPALLKKDFIIETGIAKGIDASIKYDYKRIYLWAVYSLGFVDREDEVMHYVPHYDRRHNINIVNSYAIGKSRSIEVDIRWNYGSGFPFTKTQGFYEKIVFNDGLLEDFAHDNGELGILYADYNKGRLPNYHRLDINVKKKIKISKNANAEFFIGATNLYNQKNIFYFDRIAYKRIDQLPIMPSAGFNLSF